MPLHDKFSSSIATYQLKFTVQDSGSPAPLNATITAYGKIKEKLFTRTVEVGFHEPGFYEPFLHPL